jgi:peptidoglycan/xylan/chitin deacetylase (PgdA/CDA1 family)
MPRFLISLDFELMWGVREKRTIETYGANILGARAAIPMMLALFREHRIRATWATVGMLLFDTKKQLLDALPDLRPTYENTLLDPYASLESIGPDESTDPFHFGLSLARTIVECEGMELASHTFSHYFALDPGQTRDQFAADLEASVRTIETLSERPKSIVFPRNQVNPSYFDICREAGFEAFRGTEGGWIYRAGDSRGNTLARRGARLVDAYVSLSGSNAAEPEEHAGLTDLPASRFLRPYSSALGRLDWLRVRRITTAMETAARTNRTFHLWWHPHNFGASTAKNLDVLRIILRAFQDLNERYGMQSQTMAEAAAEVGRRCR